VGSWAWAQRTGGRLQRTELVRFLARGALGQLAGVSERWLAIVGVGGSAPTRLDPDSIAVPDTRAAREAEECCAALPAFLAAHSHRTYLWGAMLAQHDRTDFDAELLYLACLLHDTGLADAVHNQDRDCFTLRSGAAAVGLTEPLGWPAPRRESLADAITLHMNTHLEAGTSVEARLLNAAAALDVVGTRAWTIDPASRQAVVSLHGRHQFKRDFAGLMSAHAGHAPGTRTHAVWRYAGLGRLIHRAPFDG
jgi:hypothetical protein